ncbi:MAG TPA: SufD family Fe-S cluster assembly protein, partial [Candidatus Norongarragalinales archaeon]|nr:SufD family Fe-S cluster assembly protein [Candidatus Norongarragalinales archaeon]
REVKATDNHPFLVLHKKGKLTLMRWTPLAEIKTGDYVGVSGALPDMGNPYKLPSITQKRAQKKIRIPAETSTELMWLLGFYLGDGYPDNARVCFACPPSDRSHEKVIKTVQDLFGLCHTQAGVVIRINSISFVRWIRDIGFIGNARTKRVPGWVFRIPHEQKKALIEGYVAADGYFRKGHKNISITSVNRPLLEDIKTLSLSCGLSPSKISRWVRREKKPLGKEEKTYEHYFLYFAEQLPETSIQFTKVSEIIPCGNEVTYDIEVDGSHNFIANGIFVHNSKVTMKYPSVLLMEPGARGEVVSIAFAGKGQHQDAGAKIFHLAPNTSSLITSKSVSKDGGRTTYRGLLHVSPNACGVKSNVECDALILDEKSASDTVPYMQIHNDDVSISHEASVSKLDDEKLFYLRSRGFTEKAAKQMLVQGFMEPFIRHLPMEYAVELNRLIDLEMEGSVG